MNNNPLFLTWSTFLVGALFVDFGVYFYQRYIWKKSGVILTDQFWEKLSESLRRMIAEGRPRKLQPAPALPKPVIVVEEPAVEVIPVSVEMVGEVRRVEFSLEMELNSKVNVRIGATPEAGVKVEKRAI